MFDNDLEIRGACGTPKAHHADSCDPVAVQRVAAVEDQWDRELEALLAAVSAP